MFRSCGPLAEKILHFAQIGSIKFVQFVNELGLDNRQRMWYNVRAETKSNGIVIKL